MATVIPTPSDRDPGLQGLHVKECADEILRRLAVRWAGESFVAIPGGQATSDWNVLVNGKNYRLPTPAMDEDISEITSDVLSDPDYFDDEEG